MIEKFHQHESVNFTPDVTVLCLTGKVSPFTRISHENENRLFSSGFKYKPIQIHTGKDKQTCEKLGNLI